MIQLLLFLMSFQPIKVSEFTLDNGLQLLVYEDHFAPVVSTQVYYRVGSYNEPRGLTGISHLLEHMIFKGTKKYGPKVYDEMIKREGGEENGFTSTHETGYFANLNRDRYMLELELEADRMVNCLIDPKEFVPEKGVVMEERRLTDNDPYGNFFEMMDLTSFTTHPYRNPTLGFMADLERISRDDVYAWYKKYYNPANAIIAVSGDVVPEEVFKQVKKYYQSLKGTVQKDDVHVEPAQSGERRFELKRDVMMPATAMLYHTVPIKDEDSYPLEVIAMILSEGRSSRFERDVIRGKNIATKLNAYASHLKYAGSFFIFGIPQYGIDIATLEKEIDNQISDLKINGVSEDELNRAKNLVLAQAVYQLDSPTGIGFAIAYYEICTGTWEYMNTYPEEIQKVTREDVMRVANKYLVNDNRTVGHLLPAEKKEEK